MGNLYSSVAEEARQFKELAGNDQTPNNYNNTPSVNDGKQQQKLAGFIDPRSPSDGVTRTPLEIQERGKKLEKMRINNLINKENNVPQQLTVTDCVKTPTGPPKESFPAFDPRSPNPEINRTPIAHPGSAPVGRKMFQD